MNTERMNCNDARERIDARGGRDHGPVDPALRQHMEGCEDCRRQHEQMIRLRADLDALPRSIDPPRDLWAGIQSRIESPRVVKGTFGAGERSGGWRRWGLLAAAAMLLVVTSSGLTAWLMQSAPTAPAPQRTDPAVAMGVAWQEFEAAETEYQRITAELLQTLDERRDRLTPETIETVEANLRLIDEAITEARAALERDPSNAALATRLTDIYRRRVGFLQQMNRL